MAYYKFKGEEGEEFGSFEVFREGSGWYWWACFPGCLPEGEPNGPFATKEEAISDANGARCWP